MNDGSGAVGADLAMVEAGPTPGGTAPAPRPAPCRLTPGTDPGPPNITERRDLMTMLFLDFEACALGPASWPIEVGTAQIVGRDVHVTSRLIRPHADWPLDAWSAESQAVHGLTLAELERTSPAAEVALWAAELIADRTLVADAPEYDQRWLHRSARDRAGHAPSNRARLRRDGRGADGARGPAAGLRRPRPHPDPSPCRAGRRAPGPGMARRSAELFMMVVARKPRRVQAFPPRARSHARGRSPTREARPSRRIDRERRRPSTHIPDRRWCRPSIRSRGPSGWTRSQPATCWRVVSP